jgi:predicted ABC-type ATPase
MRKRLAANVPLRRIRERYRRLWALVADAIVRFDNSTVYDNTGIDGPRIVAQMSGGVVVGSPTWPAWILDALCSRWPE